MLDLIKLLRGKKTYIIAFAIAVVVFAQGMEWISDGIANVVLGLLGSGALITLRAGVAGLKR